MKEKISLYFIAWLMVAVIAGGLIVGIGPAMLNLSLFF
jgi:hypothetical protein